MQLGRKIRDLRLRRGLTVQQLEVALGQGREHLHLRGVAADLQLGALVAPHQVRHLVLLDHEVGDRGLERGGQIAQGGERG